MSVEEVEVLVVGAGQAGVAASEHLTGAAIPHLVLERARIAERWRTGRWDALVANGPAWHDRFPGMEFPGDPEGFPGKDEVADYFVAYAARIKAPIRCGVEVTRVRRNPTGPGFRVETSHGAVLARQVISATGPFQRPLMPAMVPAQFAASAGITQIHSAAYRNPGQLPPGAVLVVGAGSSGAQIAEELLLAGRRVTLSVGPHGRPPRRYRGRDFVWWLGVLNKWDAEAPPDTEHVTIAVSGAGAGGGNQFDVMMIGMFETPQFGAQGLLTDLTPLATADATYQLDDILPSVRGGLSADGKLYAAPFYAESSFLMYRKDVLEAAGQTMPAAPTWDEVAAIAKAVNTPEMAGICLRGKPGWGDLGAAFTTVLNTFGGTWWLANDDGSIGAAQVDQPEFKEALSFYVDLLAEAGEPDAANASYNECTKAMLDGKAAMWYDATVAASNLEGDTSPIKGKLGYALAPTKVTEASGWLWSWALAIPKTTEHADAAWQYISFATGPDYLKQAGTLIESGWAGIPPGTRASTYAIPEYQKAAAAFAQPTLDAMAAAPIDNPGTKPRPGLPGVQYVGVPEFQDVGNQCTELFSSVIAGQTDIDTALADCQDIASQVSTG